MLLSRLFLIVQTSSFACGKQSIPIFVEPLMENVTAIKGQNVEFKCQISKLGKHMVAFARADTPPRLIAFDEKVFQQRHKYEIKRSMKDNKWILVIKDVQENDIGGYSCQVNTDPILSKTGYLRLRVPPYVARTTAAVVEVREGQNVTLSCRAFGDPPPTIVWRRQDRQIIRFNSATGYGASVFNGSDLTIIQVNRRHMSEYICVASNGVPPDESWSVKLYVTFEPMVIPQAEVVQVVLGSQASLVCNAEAWPRPSMKWEKDGQEIFDSSTFSLLHQISEKYHSVHVLTIKNISKGDFGIYRCTAVNDNGEHFADIIVKEGNLVYNKFAAMFAEEITRAQTSAAGESWRQSMLWKLCYVVQFAHCSLGLILAAFIVNENFFYRRINRFCNYII
ncbi:Lachesin [Dirofilaria immitis]